MNIQTDQQKQILQASDGLAYAFFQMKKFEIAHMQSEISVNLDPLNPGLHFNAAKCAYYNNQYEKAIEHINITMLMNKEKEASKRELALYLPWMGKFDEAIEILKQLPQDARTKFNLGWYKLRSGNYQEGFKLIEYGREIKCWGSQVEIPIPLWDGKEDITGKKLMIADEGGIGDEIIFARFALQLQRKGVDVTVCSVGEGIANIFNRMGLKTDILDNYKNYDYWAPSMGLPAIMNISTVSGYPYLTPDPEYVEKWKDRFNEGVNIGVRWQGGKLYEHDQRRTLPAKLLAKNLSGLDAQFYSIQKDSDEKCPDQFVNLEDELETWEDTLAVISHMDYIVTSCTSVTHMAAAMGKPTFVITPIVSYFTWAEKGDTTKWYDNVKIFRQTNPYNWIEPINKVTEYLEQILN